MPEEYSDDRLVFKLSSDDAVELDKLGEGFAGLAREFRRHLEQAGIRADTPQAKLFVTRVHIRGNYIRGNYSRQIDALVVP